MSLVLMGSHAQLWAVMARCKLRTSSLETELVGALPGVTVVRDKPLGTLIEPVGVNSGLQNWQMPTTDSSNKHKLLRGRAECQV